MGFVVGVEAHYDLASVREVVVGVIMGLEGLTFSVSVVEGDGVDFD